MNREEEIEFFDRYLSADLAETESEKFNQRLALDSEFRKHYESYLRTVELIKTIGLQEDVKSIMDKKTSDASRNKVVRYLLPIAAAASAILIVFFLFLNKFTGNDTSSSDLFQAYYQPYPNLIATRGSGHDLAIIMSHYSKGEFKEALRSLSDVYPVTDTLLFYRALCTISLNQPDSALLLLKQIPSESIFRQQKNWYTGMSYLLKNKPSAAISLFRDIQKNEFKYKEAHEILVRLEK